MSYRQATRFAECWTAGRLDPRHDRWKKPVLLLADNSAELRATWQALSPMRKGTLPSRVAGIPDAPEVESIDWRKLLPDSDLPW